MIDPELLRENARELIDQIGENPLASSVVHDSSGRPAAVIIVANNAEIAARLAAILPSLETKLGLELDDGSGR